MALNPGRARALKDGVPRSSPVAYWMSRDQRAHDNWALLFAQELAQKRGQPLAVVFCLSPSFLGATIRQCGFMLKGLSEVESELAARNIPFFLVHGSPGRAIPEFCRVQGIGTLVTDFDPLRIKKGWKGTVAGALEIPFYEVDSHNIIPCWLASARPEYGAYTPRGKVERLLPEFLCEFPAFEYKSAAWNGGPEKIDWKATEKSLRVNRSVGEIGWLRPGGKAAREALVKFLDHRLAQYPDDRNDPSKDGQSNLSPYLHFGQLSAQRVALEVGESEADDPAKEAFLEELIVRRELADNFCQYNPRYDSFGCFPAWARRTLDKHRTDKRRYMYRLEEFENAETHDDLWNAAQMEMVRRGKMHGYMRMYWAKKILEWTESPEDALRIAIHLNDKYELDGRDPNGYAGIAWSIGGVHDRAWPERPIFGNIRFMSYDGCKRKFNVKAYIAKVGPRETVPR